MILPSSKEPKRYVKFEIISEEKIFKEEADSSLYKKCLEFLGEEKFGQANIICVNKDIIRVDADYKDELLFAVSLIRGINNKKAVFNTLKTSGNIKKTKRG